MKKKLVSIVFIIIALTAFVLGYRSFSQPRPTEIKSSLPAVKTATAANISSDQKVIYSNKVVVLTYHHIALKEVAGLVISPERFASHLAMLQAKGFHVISLDQLQQFLKGGSVPDNALLITFDDGYESIYKYALPELKKYNMPAVNFCIVSYAGTSSGDLQYLNWDEMKEMANAGFTTQSHTFNLHESGLLANGRLGPLISGPCKGQNQADFKSALYEDLKRSKDEIESRLQQPVYALAVPHGRSTQAVREAAGKSGLTLIFTGNDGTVTSTSDPLALPRIIAGSPSVSPAELEARILRFTVKGTVTAVKK